MGKDAPIDILLKLMAPQVRDQTKLSLDLDEIQIIGEILNIEHLKVVTKEEWAAVSSSQSKNSYRSEIRSAIAHCLNAHSSHSDPNQSPSAFNTWAHLLDTGKLPVTEGWSISISHCAHIGGFALAPAPHRLGFDIEDLERLKKKPDLIQRVATPNDLSQTPHLELLWSAKEALFKSLNSYPQTSPFRQPKTLSEVETTGWRHVSKKLEAQLELFTFKGQNPKNAELIPGSGVVFIKSSLVYAFFNSFSST